MHETIGLTNCQNCGKELDQKPKAGRPKRNCSSLCRERHRQKLKLKPKVRHTCQYCQAQFDSSSARRFCSKDCRLDAGRIESRVRYWEARKERASKLVTTECGWCKQPRTYEFGKSTVRAYHPACTIEARRARYRIKTVKRQGLVNKPSTVTVRSAT